MQFCTNTNDCEIFETMRLSEFTLDRNVGNNKITNFLLILRKKQERTIFKTLTIVIPSKRGIDRDLAG